MTNLVSFPFQLGRLAWFGSDHGDGHGIAPILTPNTPVPTFNVRKNVGLFLPVCCQENAW